MISPTLSPLQINIWNFPVVLRQHQACLDFAAKCLKETPMAAEFGEVDTGVSHADSEDESLFVSDTDSDSD